MVHWVKQRGARPSERQTRRQLRTTAILGPVIAFAFTVWAGFLFDYGNAYQQAFIALMVLICATVTAVCTAVMPLTSTFVLVAACIPFALKILLEGNPVLMTMVIAFAAIGTVLQRILRQYYTALSDITANQHLLAKRNAEISEAKQEITRIAYTDELTQIANKRWFDQELEKALKQRGESDPLLIIGVIDLDGFATINDVFGYAFGDAVICEAAKRLEGAVGERGFVARYEGDEFAFVLDGANDTDHAVELGAKICQSLEAHYSIGAHTAILAASCGLAAHPVSGKDAELLRNRAYYALHEVKTSLRTNIALFSPEHERSIQYQSQVEQALRKAIHEKQLELVFQPIMDVETGLPTSFEALARWQDPELGPIFASTFRTNCRADRAGRRAHGSTARQSLCVGQAMAEGCPAFLQHVCQGDCAQFHWPENTCHSQ